MNSFFLCFRVQLQGSFADERDVRFLKVAESTLRYPQLKLPFVPANTLIEKLLLNSRQIHLLIF